MKIDYILTAFSPAMFGAGMTVHIKPIPMEEAQSLISQQTRIMATRVSHERLARIQFREAGDLTRYADLKPGMNAIHLHYRGGQISDSGEMPADAIVTPYLIETEPYVEAE